MPLANRKRPISGIVSVTEPQKFSAYTAARAA
jgi:hypothetical protein